MVRVLNVIVVIMIDLKYRVEFLCQESSCPVCINWNMGKDWLSWSYKSSFSEENLGSQTHNCL